MDRKGWFMDSKSSIKPSIIHKSGEVFCGDCIEVMKSMKSMKSQSVSLVFGSPPYSEARLYLEEGEDLGIARKPEEWVVWMIEVVKESLRVCNGLVAFVIGHGSRGCRKWTGEPALLMADLIRKGYNLRNPAIYQRQSLPGSGGNDWLRADTEFILCVTNKDEKLPWSNNKALGWKPKYNEGGPTTNRHKDDSRNNKGRKMVVAGERGKQGEVQEYKNPDISNPGNIINCGAVGGGHLGSNIAHESVAPFPVKLPSFFIKSFCPPDGIVCDPFVGSGGVIQAAIENNRRFIGIDLRPSQIELCKRRIKQAESNKGFGI